MAEDCNNLKELGDMTLDEQHKYWKGKAEKAWGKYKLAKLKEIMAWERYIDAFHDFAEALLNQK